MRLLALDTATEACSAALLLDGDLYLRCEITERGHAELILPMIDSLLSEAAMHVRDLDGLAFGRGPGGFTGLRIAAGVAQGLAFAASLPVASVSSLAAVAAQVAAGEGEPVLACNDARMGEVYWAVFRPLASGAMEALGPERVTTPDGLVHEALDVRHAAGNGLARHPGLTSRLVAAGLRIHDGLYPRADAVARLGAIELAAGRGVSAEQALPVYVRDDVARPAGPAVTRMS